MICGITGGYYPPEIPSLNNNLLLYAVYSPIRVPPLAIWLFWIFLSPSPNRIFCDEKFFYQLVIKIGKIAFKGFEAERPGKLKPNNKTYNSVQL